MQIITWDEAKCVFLALAVCRGDKGVEIQRGVHSYFLFWNRIILGERKAKCPSCGGPI